MGDGCRKPKQSGCWLSSQEHEKSRRQHQLCDFSRITGAERIGVFCRPAIAYSRVDTGRNPSAVQSNSNFPASHLGSQLGLIQSYRAFASPPETPQKLVCGGTRLSPKSHARLATPRTPTTRGSRPRRLEGPGRRKSEPSYPVLRANKSGSHSRT